MEALPIQNFLARVRTRSWVDLHETMSMSITIFLTMGLRSSTTNPPLTHTIPPLHHHEFLLSTSTHLRYSWQDSQSKSLATWLCVTKPIFAQSLRCCALLSKS